MGVVLIWLDFVIQPLRKEGDSIPNQTTLIHNTLMFATHLI